MSNQVHINITNPNLKAKDAQYLNSDYTPFNLKGTEIKSEEMSTAQLIYNVSGKDLVVHFLISDRKEISATAGQLIELGDFLNSLGANSVTVELQVAVHGIYQYNNPIDLQNQKDKQNKAHADMMPIYFELKKKGIAFISLTFDKVAAIASAVKKRAEYVISLDKEEHGVHYTLDTVLRYTRNSYKARELV